MIIFVAFKHPPHLLLFPYHTENLLEAGCDEVGRGCLAGPVVAAAVILPKAFELPFLNDSKQVSVEKRNKLFEIVKEQAISWGIGEVSNEEVDRINVANASILAMHRALDQLNRRPEFLLIDGKHFKPYHFLPYQCVIKGDSKYASIAAASILAKVHRDQYMQALAIKFPGYDWETNVGYPTDAHRKGILQNGLTPLHRKTFQLTKRD